jgi:hypothetical protein
MNSRSGPFGTAPVLLFIGETDKWVNRQACGLFVGGSSGSLGLALVEILRLEDAGWCGSMQGGSAWCRWTPGLSVCA